MSELGGQGEKEGAGVCLIRFVTPLCGLPPLPPLGRGLSPGLCNKIRPLPT